MYVTFRNHIVCLKNNCIPATLNLDLWGEATFIYRVRPQLCMGWGHSYLWGDATVIYGVRPQLFMGWGHSYFSRWKCVFVTFYKKLNMKLEKLQLVFLYRKTHPNLTSFNFDWTGDRLWKVGQCFDTWEVSVCPLSSIKCYDATVQKTLTVIHLSDGIVL